MKHLNGVLPLALCFISGLTLLTLGQGNCEVKIDDFRMHIISQELLSAYKSAALSASNPTPSKISHTLFPITNSNKKLKWRLIKGEDHVLVVNLMEDDRKFDGRVQIVLDSIVWVTVIPELIELCANYLLENPTANITDIGLRLSQSLGLPGINIGYTLVEFWVRPQDLFRPCPDPEITDERCDLHFPDDVSDEHREWINTLRSTTYADAHRGVDYGGFPWTQLGYTYDWRPETSNPIGPSEYVIKKGSIVYLNKIYNIMDYCRQ